MQNTIQFVKDFFDWLFKLTGERIAIVFISIVCAVQYHDKREEATARKVQQQYYELVISRKDSVIDRMTVNAALSDKRCNERIEMMYDRLLEEVRQATDEAKHVKEKTATLNSKISKTIRNER